VEIVQEKFLGNREELEVFHSWLEILNRAQISYLLGGAFAVYLHAGTWRDTKDLDVFLQAKDLRRVLEVFAEAGYKTEILSTHWLAKVSQGPYFSDLLFGFWNGRLETIQNWLERSKPALFAGITVPVISLEDLIYSKIYVAGRERFDGADIVHLIQRAKGKIDWTLVIDQLGDDYGLLLWHLILYDYVYPGHLREDERELILLLFERVRESWPAAKPSLCFRGPLIDPFSFQIDREEMGYSDPRDMTPLVDSEGNLL
jgi:Nucleotidyl transferase of unknown function (DUF2204)